MKLKKFNLVEVIIAMGIVVVCITTILGLFSAGMKVTKEATSKTYTNQITEQISGLLDTNTTIINNFNSYIPTSRQFDTNSDYKAAETGCSTVLDSNDPSTSNFYYDGNDLEVMVVKFTSDVNGSTVTDFSAAVRMWRESSGTYTQVTVSNGATVDLANDVIKIEITWPLTMKYENRELAGNIITYRKVLKP